MSRTTDALLFAILLVLVHISLILQENPGSNSTFFGFLGLFIGLVAVSGSLLAPLLSGNDQSN